MIAKDTAKKENFEFIKEEIDEEKDFPASLLSNSATSNSYYSAKNFWPKDCGLWSKIEAFYHEFKPFFLSHHPSCSDFEGHTLKVGKVRLCIGCFVGYPSAIIGIILFTFLINNGTISLLSLNFLTIGIIGLIMMGFLGLSFTRFTKIVTIKILQKIILGAGSGFMISWVWFFFDGNTLLKIIRVWITIIILNIPISLIHIRNHKEICTNCKYKHDWDFCPGMNLSEIKTNMKNRVKNIHEKKSLQLYQRGRKL